MSKSITNWIDKIISLATSGEAFLTDPSIYFIKVIFGYWALHYFFPGMLFYHAMVYLISVFNIAVSAFVSRRNFQPSEQIETTLAFLGINAYFLALFEQEEYYRALVQPVYFVTYVCSVFSILFAFLITQEVKKK